MIHYMHLHPHPFSLIEKGIKTIELRLYDEKRKLISVGDTLFFFNTEYPHLTLTCTVVALHKFSNFKALYSALPIEKCGYLPHELVSANYKDMEKYYTKRQQQEYGVVGIELTLLPKDCL